MRLCNFEGCGREHKAKGLCRAHYEQRYVSKKELTPIRNPKPRESNTCIVKDCTRRDNGFKGMCRPHYARYVRWGDPLGGKQRYWDTPTLDVIVERVEERQGPLLTNCHIYTGHINVYGYGVISHNNYPHLVHRLILAEKLGRNIREDHWALHKCDVRACINPEHLYEGTPTDNARDTRERHPKYRGGGEVE